MPIDAAKLASDIVAAAEKVGSQRWSQGEDFAVHGAQTLAALAVSTTAAILSKQLDQQGVTFMQNIVVQQTHQFALTLANLVIAAAAAMIDAVLGVVWGALTGALKGTPFAGLLPAQPTV